MAVRTLFLLFLLLLPAQVGAGGYRVRAGETLAGIAARYHVSVATLVRVNRIRNPNLIVAGQEIVIPARVRRIPRHTYWYRVRWGDSFSGIEARYRIPLSTLRSLNPRLGAYPLAGQWLRLCGPCGGTEVVSAATTFAELQRPASGIAYVVRPGDTLTGIASRYGTTISSLLAANHLYNADRIVIGSRLSVPASGGSWYDPLAARSAIVSYARQYGLDPSLPLAIGWQESGFNNTLVSRTGAIGVMQVEPYTEVTISRLVGRPFNLHNVDDNVHAGVFWLSRLLTYYGGNERLAIAAYYEGSRAIARVGLYQDTIQYVRDVLALQARFGG